MQQQASRAGRFPAALLALAAIVLALAIIRPAYAAAPTITLLTPNSGPTAGGNTVTITGTGFTSPGTSVTFDGAAAGGLVVTNSTTLSVTAPAHAAGAVSVIVTNADGPSLAATYTYVATPAVTLLTPATGTTAGGDTVVITGAGFTGATMVTFGGTAAVAVVGNDTTITATAPAHIAGVVDVRVTGPGGTSANTAADDYTYTAPVPAVTALSPASSVLAGGTVVTVTGTGFTGATSVMFGTVAGTSISVLTDTSLTVLSPAQVAGVVDVVVTTAGGSSATSAASKFTYQAVAAPVITAVTPTSGSTAGGTTVVITGASLGSATGVTFGGVAGTGLSANTATSVTVTTPAHVAGTVDVVVTTAGGPSAISAVAKFTYTAAAAPTVTDVTPGGGPIAGGTAVTITGAGLTGATSVTFGGTASTFTVVNSTTITATSPAHAAGNVDVLVTTPAGTSAVSADAKFLYGAAPAVTAVSPSTGSAGVVVTITGTGLTGATSVLFGDASATPATVSDTSITVTAPSHAAGAVNIQVVTPTGTSAVVSAATFTYGSATVTYTLSVRWSLIVWQGTNGMSVASALAGTETPDNPATNSVTSRVTAIFRWDGGSQSWKAYFPGSEGVPGANDFTTLTKGEAYWIAINGTSSTTWTVLVG